MTMVCPPRRLPLALVLSISVACAHGLVRPFGLDDCRERGGAACREAASKELAAGDDGGRLAAAAFLMTGCESGDAPACAELARLYHAGSGVVRDEAEACRLGLTEACAAGEAGAAGAADVGASGPMPVNRSAWPYPPGEATARDEALFFEARGWTYPEVWRQALGLTPSALKSRPPAPRLERELMDVVTGPRLRAAEACLPVLVPAAGTLSVPTSAVASFTVGKNGRPAELVVRVLPEGHRWAAEWERCISDLIGPWRLPALPSGGRFWLTIEAAAGERRDDHLGETGTPAFPARGFTKPVMANGSCVRSTVRVARPAVTGPITFQFAVRADGAPDLFKVVTAGVPADMAAAVWDAIRTCRWIPGRDDQDRPVTMWVILPLRFAP